MLLGVAASLLIGLSDFFGRRCSDSSGPLATVNVAYWAGGTTALLGALVMADDFIGHDVLLGVASGPFIAVALWSVYKGFVASSTGVTAPVAAVALAAVPVLIDLVQGRTLGARIWLGIAVGLVALVATSWAPAGNVAAGAGWGAFGGLAFATGVLITAETSEASGIWPAVGQRYTAGVLTTAVALAAAQDLLPRAGERRWAASSGIVGTIGIAALVVGTQRGDTTLVVVAGSFFPAVTIALSSLLDGEQMRWWQWIGLAGALAGVTLITTG